VSADGEHWFLLNASPDVRDQVQLLNGHPPAGMRHVPIEGVVLTDAEIDHSLGLVLLRESRALRVYATPSVEAMLARDSKFLAVTRAFADVQVTALAPGVATPLTLRDGSASGLAVEPFTVVADPPRFAPGAAAGHTIGLVITDNRGHKVIYAPGAGGLDERIAALMNGADLVLFDGTFWSDDELITLGIGERTARQMDHLPVSGPGGSLERLARIGAGTRAYVHINNTNPMLLEDSPERAAVTAAGILVGHDGMRFTL
jgi:pyrroloquinoline quinone biosynthesis protein B